MSVIVNRTMSYQVSESDFDVITESTIFSDNATLNDVKRWYDELNKKCHFYASPVIDIQFKE